MFVFIIFVYVISVFKNQSIHSISITLFMTLFYCIPFIISYYHWSLFFTSLLYCLLFEISFIFDHFYFYYFHCQGYATGGTQIQPFRSVGLMNFGFNNNVTLVHNTYIYITAIATNGADLRGISYSDPILVDLTPPDIKFVNDGLGKQRYKDYV